MDRYWKEYVDFVKGKGSIDEVLIIDSTDGGLWASSDENFFLKEYKALIMQEDGTEKEEVVNEAKNIVRFMKGEKCSQGLRINANPRKYQITRSFKDETTDLQVLYAKIPNGGACIANAGKCILLGTFNEGRNHNSVECNETIQLMAYYLCKSTWPDKEPVAGEGGAVGGGPVDVTSIKNVTWQMHIEKALIERGNIAEAMIVNCENGEILASVPPTFKVC
jgi:ribosomal protein L24E